jgi:hypothetical protein
MGAVFIPILKKEKLSMPKIALPKCQSQIVWVWHWWPFSLGYLQIDGRR